MRNHNLLLVFILNLLFFSCGSNSDKKTTAFSLKTSENKSEFQLGETINLSLENKKNRMIDSVNFYFENHLLQNFTKNFSIAIPLQNQKLGNQSLKAIVYSNGETDTIAKAVKIYNALPPATYTYEIISTFPHDKEAYTQGFEFYNDTLYESTGKYGKSSLRKLNMNTGEVLQQINLDEEYFGEGLTIWDGKIYLLTWKAKEGFIYDLNFNKTGSFSYNQSAEGWGLTHDDEKVYKSDGTEKIWILDPETLAEQEYIQTVTNRTISSKLNELEWVEGKIYANTYQKDGVAIINPENGAIEGLIDFRGLRENLGNKEDLDPLNDVLNGIAYNPNSKKLYVTGKKWDKIFEVKIIKK